jgi:hypothetical protein
VSKESLDRRIAELGLPLGPADPSQLIPVDELSDFPELPVESRRYDIARYP